MSNSKFLNMARLMTTYNLDIDNEVLPDNLKCIKCKLVLKDACAVPCGCRFCRGCIDELIASEIEFCPGDSDDCGDSVLSYFATDFRANKNVSKLAVKCPQSGCQHECKLVEMEEHMQVCSRMNVVCPFYKFGCKKTKFATDEISEHFQHEYRSHSEILIGMIADINREMESYKREIELLKRNDESNKSEIELLKKELVLTAGQTKTIIDKMQHLENENILIKDELKSIKEEKADLADYVRILSEKIEHEINERQESDERVIDNVNREINVVTDVIRSNKDEINDDIDCIKSQVQSIQTLVGLGQIDASCEWTIDKDMEKSRWGRSTSECFIGAVYPYKYRLSSWNTGVELGIHLCIYPGQSDAQLPWPMSGTVVITVMDISERDTCKSITRQCKINRPPDNQYSNSFPFRFLHYSLIGAELDLDSGVRVSCVIVPSSAD